MRGMVSAQTSRLIGLETCSLLQHEMLAAEVRSHREAIYRAATIARLLADSAEDNFGIAPQAIAVATHGLPRVQ